MTNISNFKKIGVALLTAALLMPLVINSVNAQQVTLNGAVLLFHFL